MQESLATLVTDIQLALIKNNALSALFLDIEEVYDNVNTNILFKKIFDIGIHKTLEDKIYKIYSTRYIGVTPNGRIREMSQT